ncbi:MAG: hypothetical protein OXE46_03895 [Chloroflexi bacterium]|nr:hypothetical protein [Chloroflexota bacterium]
MQFANTPTNMAQTVSNIIDSYKMGALRALAQEPVQNALDAKRLGHSAVMVEYRLLKRSTDKVGNCYLLTVTDTGTTGLRGQMVSKEELEARDFKLKPEENWAAFEAQGYSKENEDALGSRGQGKAAFLYHSHIPGQTRRMAMLYDTLLEDGEYRLGMRFARPVDQVMTPPLFNEEARATILSDQFPLDDNLAIPLNIEALREVGTRVIVPCVNDELAAAMCPGGELSRWLQRCWWRAIQLSKLSIRVVDEHGASEEIAVPRWWSDLPRIKGKPSPNGSWVQLRDGGRACIWGDLPLEDGYTIRRLVMLHSDDFEEDEITKDEPEYAGIQILRGSQWIVTRDARREYYDFIPREKLAGFRGYVEFDKHTDSALRAAENSQHDGFGARGNKGKIVRNIRSELKKKVCDFSAAMG